jgi:hypothetical protein
MDNRQAKRKLDLAMNDRLLIVWVLECLAARGAGKIARLGEFSDAFDFLLGITVYCFVLLGIFGKLRACGYCGVCLSRFFPPAFFPASHGFISKTNRGGQGGQRAKTHGVRTAAAVCPPPVDSNKTVISYYIINGDECKWKFALVLEREQRIPLPGDSSVPPVASGAKSSPAGNR